MKKLFIKLFFLAIPFLVFAQNENEVKITLESPYNTMLVHLHYLQGDSYQPGLAAKTIYGVADSAKAVKRGIQLKQVLDGKGLFVHLNQVPQDSNYIDTLSSGRAIYTPFPKELPEIYLEKIDSKWYYSKTSVQEVPIIHKKVYPFGSDLILNMLPKFGQNKVLGLAAWQFLGIALLILMALIVHIILSRILNPIVSRLSKSKIYPSLIPSELIWKIARYLSVFLIIRMIKIFLPALQLPIEASEFTFNVIKIVTTLLVVAIALRVLDIFILYTQTFTLKTESKMDEQLVPIMKRSLQAIIVIGGIFQILSVLSINVTALIAGLSIGGLALALAAQDTVKNLIGSAMIFVDQPFQIGDYIEFGSESGTVVEVGFRTTRIQKPDSSIVAVPNGSIANSSVTNKGVRVFRLFHTTLGVTYDTPPDLIEKFLYGLKQLIITHPKTAEEGWYVHFNSMGASSLDIMFRVPLEVSDYASELRVKEELLFGILRLAEHIGVNFAFPTTTLIMEQFPEKESLSPVYQKTMADVDKEIKDFVGKYRQAVEKSEGVEGIDGIEGGEGVE